MLRDMKVKTRILFVLGVLAAGYLVLLGVVQVTASLTHSRMTRLSTSIFPAALKVEAAEASFEKMTKHYGDAVVLQDPGALAGADKDANDADQALSETKSLLAADPVLGEKAAGIAKQFNELRARDKDTYAAVLASKDGPTESLMGQVGALGKDNAALAKSIGALDGEIAANFQAQLAGVDALSLRGRLIGLGMLLFALAACTGAWWIVERQVAARLELLAARMEDIAQGDGDLTRRVEVNGHDEIDEVGKWFNVFIERIEQIVSSVAANAVQLDAAAADLAGLARETASRTAEQKGQASRIAESMSQISAAVNEISENTQNAAEDARKAEESAHAGGDTTRATIQTIQEVLSANQTTSAKIEELGRSSGAIEGIVRVIVDIADQTNLLALNASIEAARAGEHGRGFAVVAGEVRRLAERTSVATKEIDQTIRAIQVGTQHAVEAMRASMSQVKDGVDTANSAGESLTSIIHGAESLQKVVTQIAASSTEQSYSMQSVNENVNEIARIVEQTADGASRSVEACQKLSGLASELTQLVGAFKVSRESGSTKPGQREQTSGLRRVRSANTAPRQPLAASRI